MTVNRPELAGSADGSGTGRPLPTRHPLRDQDILWSDFLAMAETVIDGLEKSIDALCDARLEVIPEVKANEQRLDREEVRIEQECLRILALYEPVASDLRRTATMLKVNRDWERIGDLAARLARRARKLARQTPPESIPQALKDLARDVQARTRQCFDALARRDPVLARTVIDGDHGIDVQYRAIRKDLKQRIRENSEQLTLWLQLMNAARNLERIADHSTSIAQMIVYLQEGIFLRHRGKRSMLDQEGPPC